MFLRFRWVTIVVVVIATLIGGFRYHQVLLQLDPHFVHFWNGTSVEVIGWISDLPSERIERTQLVVSVITLNSQVTEGKILVSVLLEPTYRYGERVQFTCVLQEPQPIDGFAYDRYLAVRGISSLCFRPKIVLVDGFSGSWIRSRLLGVREWVAHSIEQSLPEPHASLLVAMLVDGAQLPEDVRAEFAATGTTHVIAISGFNLTLLIGLGFLSLLRLGCSRRAVILVVSVGIGAYLILIGFPASAVRAAGMAWLVLGAMVVGRVSRPWYALLLSAAVMVWINPLILRDDVGFQLSVLAMLGLLVITPRLESQLIWIPEWFGLRLAVAATLGAQVATLPIIVWNFGQLSFIAPFANIVVAPLLPVILISGIMGAAGSGVFGSAAPLWPAWIFLDWLLALVHWASLVPFGVISL